ncbi:MAG: TIGR01458 family HAD-type hydrolase [Gammaproteobacteria bacterium]
MIRALLIDLDGVLYQAGKVIPGAAETIRWIQEKEIPHLFVTNTSSRSRRKIIEKLEGLGFKIPEKLILTPSIAACKWLSENVSGKSALYVPDTTKEDFTSIPILEEGENTVAAVVLGDMGEKWTFPELNRAFTYLTNEPQPTLVALGMTRYWRTEVGLQLDIGPFVKALEYAANCKAVVLGKPSIHFFEAALQILKCEPSQAIMIGDDIIGDVQGAQNAGLKGVLVRTGKFRVSDIKGEIQPDAIIDSIADLPTWLNQQ